MTKLAEQILNEVETLMTADTAGGRRILASLAAQAKQGKLRHGIRSNSSHLASLAVYGASFTTAHRQASGALEPYDMEQSLLRVGSGNVVVWFRGSRALVKLSRNSNGSAEMGNLFELSPMTSEDIEDFIKARNRTSSPRATKADKDRAVQVLLSGGFSQEQINALLK